MFLYFCPLFCIRLMQENELHLSSVMEVSSPWKEREPSSFVSKLVRMDTDTTAIILKDDINKSLRFVFLALLMSKKNASNMQNLIAKIGQIKTTRNELNLKNLPQSVARLLPSSIKDLHTQMHELAKKLQNHNYAHSAILKLAHEFVLIDPLLIAALRTVAEDCKMSNALDWSVCLGLTQTEALMGKVTMEKDKRVAGLSGRNRYVLFFPLTELELDLFRSRKVVIAKESQCYEELSDFQTLKYQDYLMIEKTYSLL